MKIDIMGVRERRTVRLGKKNIGGRGKTRVSVGVWGFLQMSMRW